MSDGWGGHREALVQVYGQVPEYQGRGRPPTRKQPLEGWHYTQMVKQRDATGNLSGIDIRVIYGDETTLSHTGTRTVYVERTNLTSRLMNGRLVRKTLGFSKALTMLQASCVWEDVVYNFTRSVTTLRVEVMPQTERRWIPLHPQWRQELLTMSGQFGRSLWLCLYLPTLFKETTLFLNVRLMVIVSVTMCLRRVGQTIASVYSISPMM